MSVMTGVVLCPSNIYCTYYYKFFHQITIKFHHASVWFGTRQHFELMVIIKVDTMNDVVTTVCTMSKQSPCAIFSASTARIVHQEIE